MANGVQMTLQMADGRAVGEYMRVIDKRVQLLKEDRRKAVGVAMVNVLTSLRKRTRKAPTAKNEDDRKLDRYFDMELVTREVGIRTVNGVRKWVALSGGHHVSVLPSYRVHGCARAEMGAAGLWRFTFHSPHKATRRLKNPPSYYVLAPDETSAKAYARSRAYRYARSVSGLADATTAIAQIKLCNRINQRANAGGVVLDVTGRKTAQANADCQVYDTDAAGYHIHCASKLSYATDALDGGQNAVTEALVAATNKQIGYLRHRFGELFDKA